MYLVIVDYKHEILVEEIKTKKLVKEYIEKNKRGAVGFEIYKVTKKLSVDDFKSNKI
jgi:hypothetical protein